VSHDRRASFFFLRGRDPPWKMSSLFQKARSSPSRCPPALTDFPPKRPIALPCRRFFFQSFGLRLPSFPVFMVVPLQEKRWCSFPAEISQTSPPVRVGALTGYSASSPSPDKITRPRRSKYRVIFLLAHRNVCSFSDMAPLTPPAGGVGPPPSNNHDPSEKITCLPLEYGYT